MQQSKKQEEIPKRSIDIKALLIFLFIAAIVGLAIYKCIKYFYCTITGEKIWNETDLINYLESVLDSYEPDDIDHEVLIKGKEIKAEISKRFRNNILGKVRYQGSADQGTSLSGYSDLDILIQFKKTSFKKEKDMYDSVYNYLKYNFPNSDSDLVRVREQRVSLGLIYDINGFEEIIDIVPALRTDFKKGGNEYHLYVNPKFSEYEEKLKINTHKQRDLGDYPLEKIKIITLLKLLMKTQELPLKSVLITELTKKAFDKIGKPKNLNQQLIKVLEYIRDNIETIKIAPPDNYKTCLTDELYNSQKKRVKIFLNDVLQDIKEDKNAWIDYFPEK